MAKFKPGQSGNPGGRRKLPADVQAAKNLTNNQLILILNRLMFMTDMDILNILADPATPKFEKAVAKVLQKADQYGDPGRLEFLLNRTVGKVTEKVQHTLPRPMVIQRSDGSQTVLAAQMPEEDENGAEMPKFAERPKGEWK